MPAWLNLILKVVLFAFLGALLGGGIGFVWFLIIDLTHPWNKTMGSQDSYAMARGFTAIGLVLIGGLLGATVATIATVVVHVRKLHAKSQ